MPKIKSKILSNVRKGMRALVPAVYFAMGGRRAAGDTAKLNSPRNILLIHPGHIGDVVIATAVIPVLRSAFPQAKIGFVTGVWSKAVVENHPDIAYNHRVDHWRLNRADISFWQKWTNYRQTRRNAIREVRRIGYDLSINLLNVDPDLLNLPWWAGIPVRVGFQGSFFAALATRTAAAPDSPFVHQADRQAALLHALKIRLEDMRLFGPVLQKDTEEAVKQVCGVFGIPSLDGFRYRTIHVGAGAPMKEMPVSFWREVAVSLCGEHRLLFTGRGARESEQISQVIRDLPNCYNACDRFDWAGFVTAIRHSEALYGVDSMAGHVASAVQTRSVMAYHGAGGVARWRPYGDRTTVFTVHLPCAPCNLPYGCSEMPCKHVPAGDIVSVTF